MDEKNLFANTERVTFELSNICNYGTIHPLCPVSKFTEKIVLRKKAVHDVLDVLGTFNYSGWVTFYGYSEPLIDPRFQSFVEYAKRVCPTCVPMVTTNGFMLTQETVDELGDSGLAFARVSAYTPGEFARLSALNGRGKMKIHVRAMGGAKWRPRIDNYTDPPNGLRTPCFSPLIDIRITTRGKVGLCCVDYENRHTFADLAETSFLDVMKSGILQTAFARLTKGDRSAFDLCRRCGVARKHGGI